MGIISEVRFFGYDFLGMIFWLYFFGDDIFGMIYLGMILWV